MGVEVQVGWRWDPQDIQDAQFLNTCEDHSAWTFKTFNQDIQHLNTPGFEVQHKYKLPARWWRSKTPGERGDGDHLILSDDAFSRPWHMGEEVQVGWWWDPQAIQVFKTFKISKPSIPEDRRGRSRGLVVGSSRYSRPSPQHVRFDGSVEVQVAGTLEEVEDAARNGEMRIISLSRYVPREGEGSGGFALPSCEPQWAW
ncbi:hypothetical protein NLI96_g10750 [Meripilus lineatus]|uniref:Uncharacterized protein n=1 Tax=Meripilus lineatus TaxID=2056292 RepID=A0AAD5YE19_9APHY|nr:hypothetical protein NLI96_g10750 [Physisporinus lineatus]